MPPLLLPLGSRAWVRSASAWSGQAFSVQGLQVWQYEQCQVSQVRVQTVPGAAGMSAGPSVPLWELGGEEALAAAAGEFPKRLLSVSFFTFSF